MADDITKATEYAIDENSNTYKVDTFWGKKYKDRSTPGRLSFTFIVTIAIFILVKTHVGLLQGVIAALIFAHIAQVFILSEKAPAADIERYNKQNKKSNGADKAA